LVGNGSLPFIDLLGWALLERADTVLVESPTYDRTLTLLRRHGVRIVGVPINGGGLDLDALEAAVRATPPRLLYTIPDFQNPAGATATLAVRRRVAELAAEHGFWILEDAPYRPLRYRGTELVSLRELSPARTLHMSSFTKQISPGVRVGYLIGDARVVARIAKAAEDTYITPNLLGEAAVYEFCRRGLLEPQLERLRALYRPRLEAACAAMRRWLPDAQWTEPDGAGAGDGAQHRVRRVPLEAPRREVGATRGVVVVVLEELAEHDEVEGKRVARRVRRPEVPVAVAMAAPVDDRAVDGTHDP